MRVRMTNSNPPILESTLTKFENEIGVSLPSDYKEFLLQHNGGCPHPDYFPMQGPTPELSFGELQFLFSFSPGDSLDLRWNLKTYRQRVPSDLLPIGCDPGGNLLCIAISGEQRGAMYFWDHGFETAVEGKKPPDYSNVYFVAPSFTHLLESLYSGKSQ
jgi:hypothetical protein